MNWQPIDTAPKDRRILLYFPTMFNEPYACVGEWEDDRYAKKKPRPYWTADIVRWASVTRLRACPPTHWCEIVGPAMGGAEREGGK